MTSIKISGNTFFKITREVKYIEIELWGVFQP